MVKVLLSIILTSIILVHCQDTTLPFCKSTEQKIEFDHDCAKADSFIEKIKCVSSTNDMENIASQYDDEFTHLNIIGDENSIFYSLNGQLYSTSCQDIDLADIEIPEKVYFFLCYYIII